MNSRKELAPRAAKITNNNSGINNPKLKLHERLTLSIRYKGAQCNTKAIVDFDSSSPLYKIALYSQWTAGCAICWLVQTAGEWKAVVGNIEGSLIRAISKAIEKADRA